MNAVPKRTQIPAEVRPPPTGFVTKKLKSASKAMRIMFDLTLKWGHPTVIHPALMPVIHFT